MLPGKFTIDKTNAEIINLAINNNKRIAAVGTISVRVLEFAASKAGFLKTGKTFIKNCAEETSIFIYPVYKFKIINILVTNLHLLKSTPLVIQVF